MVGRHRSRYSWFEQPSQPPALLRSVPRSQGSWTLYTLLAVADANKVTRVDALRCGSVARMSSLPTAIPPPPHTCIV